MRLDRLPEYVTTTVAIIVGIGLALMAGQLAGSGRIGLLLLIGGSALAVGFAVATRGGVWLLIPATFVLEGQIPDLPLPFAVRDIVVGVVFASYCVFVALKMVRVKPKIGFLDIVVFANLLYLAITFLRHPVGVDVLGSERVGGRPYFNIFVGVLAYLVLRRVSPTTRQLAALPWCITGIQLLNGLVSLIAYLVPWTAPVLGRIYTGVSQEAYENENLVGAADPAAERLGFLSGSGLTLATLLCSLKRPITLLLPWFPGRFFFFVVAMLAVALSGHRSTLLIGMFTFTLASYYWDRIRDAIGVALIGTFLLCALLLAQGRIVELPIAVQRTLSWLPGDWNYAAVSNAQHSTDWRVEMWKIALTDPTYIEDKLWGDGFGFTKWDLAVIGQADAARRTGMATYLSTQEVALWVGNYHSGPISTLHIVGAVGSLLFYTLLFGIAVYAHKLVLRAKGTPQFTTALFVCIPNVMAPFTFVVIFGDFGSGYPMTLMSLGLLQVLERGLPEVPMNRFPEGRPSEPNSRSSERPAMLETTARLSKLVNTQAKPST